MRLQGWTRAALLSLAIAVIGAFALLRARSGFGSLDSTTVRDNLPALGAATVLFALATLMLASAWIALIEGSTRERSAKRGRLYIAFAVAWIARYVPGTVPFFAGKVYLGRNLGYASRPLLIATGIENVLEILIAGMVGCSMLVVSQGDRSGAFYGIGALGLVAGLGALHPAIFSRLANRILTLARREPVPREAFPSMRTLGTAATFVVMNQVTNGIALMLILHATGGVEWTQIALVTGALSLAGVAGLLVVIAPAGFGVRDGALAALLATQVAVGVAAGAAVLMRAVTIVADLLLVLVALACDALSGGHVARGILRGQSQTTPQAVSIVAEKAA